MKANDALQRRIAYEEEAAAAELERREERRVKGDWETQSESQRAFDRRPLGSRFQDTCRITREGGGLPEGEIIPNSVTHDLVLQFDLPARKMEREARLLAMHDGDVDTTLVDICREGGGKDARFLLAHGADPNHRGEDGWTVLTRAAQKGQLAVLEALLDGGANMLGRKALFCAAGEGHTAVVALLLDRGADIHFADDAALYRATQHGHLETATLLLQRGATAMEHFVELAEEAGHHAVAALLRSHL